MKKIKLIFYGVCLVIASANTHADQAYFDKFMAYTEWSQHIPVVPDPEFDAFIEKPSPLTNRLRARWLYQLARNKDWSRYLQYYQGANDTSLQCYEKIALYNQGKQQQAQKSSIQLWLTGHSQPKACDDLFALLLSNHELDNALIQQRIALALQERNVSLARYLLKQLSPPQAQEAEILATVHQNPKRILELDPSALHGEFYSYGLKLLIPNNINQAVHYWENTKSKTIMNEAQQQSFLAQLALYKAMRSQPDAAWWFAQVKPKYYNDTLLDWEIRVALAHQKWRQVVYLINHSEQINEPAWQYWKARALYALGDKEKANSMFQQLASKRNYYGFLASIKLNKPLSFENEHANDDPHLLAPYKPITNDIQNLYNTHQTLAASRLLNDFVSELPKNERSALANWIANDLHWYGKSVYLSNNPELTNQLSLRFPLTYQATVQESSKTYRIPSEMIYAVIRQESAFHDEITSSAGANGLMQIMPLTAKLVAQRAKIPYSNTKQLFSSHTNITIGAAYLQQLAKQFGEHPVLMAAAYNAGPRQVNYWIKNHPPRDIDIWIETLPWRETRNYLKNVIAFYAVYQYRMNEKPNLNAFMKPFWKKDA